eukprot:TRINITY_DN2750_c0_g2_i1.p2 TRINITY_DN2750_c0_g2~~TRINITY_DN2750_c0_g2_i1.p2  ORF type:complete len:65 (+),score=6.86 TRINITY_DN2750_c0_g2_i1:2-196(+)
MVAEPSGISEATKKGMIGIKALQITSDITAGRVECDMIFLLKMLPHAQLNAAARVNIKPSIATC